MGKKQKRSKGVTVKRQGDDASVFIVTFRDPRVSYGKSSASRGKKVVRKSLKTKNPALARRYEVELNRILLDKSLWKNLPEDTSEVVRSIWGGPQFSEMIGDKLVSFPIAEGEAPAVRTSFRNEDSLIVLTEGHIEQLLAEAMFNPENAPNVQFELTPEYSTDSKFRSALVALIVARDGIDQLRTEVEKFEGNNAELAVRNKALFQKLRQFEKRAAKAENIGTLQQEFDRYMEVLQERKITDKRKGILRSTLKRFMSDMGPNMPAVEITETEVSNYVQTYKDKDKKPITEERRREIRTQVCTFMESATNQLFSRKGVVRIAAHKVAREKKPIVWLTYKEASKLIENMTDESDGYWKDLATVQLHTGFRPSELILIQKSNVTKNVITLAAITDPKTGVSKAKTGSRSVQIQKDIAETVASRKRKGSNPFLFGRIQTYSAKNKIPTKRQDGQTGLLANAWNEDVFHRHYRKRLRDAAKKAGITKSIDGRTLRRSFGSIAIRQDYTVEEVAKLMGDRPQTIRKHYADLLAEEIDITGLKMTDS